jgi:transposase
LGVVMAHAWFWVGLDVGADQTIVCVTDSAGLVVSQEGAPSTAPAIHKLLGSKKRRIKLVALESGSFGIPLSRSLAQLGYPIAVFEARQASKFLSIRKNKTDKNDARGLADIGRLGRESVSEVRVKSPECQRLRSTLATRQKLIQVRVAVEGAMRSLFRLNGGKLKSSSSAARLRRNVREEIRSLRRREHIDLTEDVEPLLSLSTATRNYTETLDRRLSAEAANHAVCQRFLEIPGVGPITALCFYSAIEDPHRFHRNSDVGAYLGMVPLLRESGQTSTKLRISKSGDRLTRTYLTTAAQHHLRFANTALTDWGAVLSQRLRSRGVQVAVARKLAVVMLAMWKSGERYEPFHARPTTTLALADEVTDCGPAGWETATTIEDAPDPALG